jgi:hypothetical protein
MGNYGFKISQDGYDVKTCTDSQLVFSSKFDTMNVAVQGTSNQTNSSGGYADLTFTITHGLSFIPYIMAYYKLSTSSSYWNWYPSGGVYFLSTDANNGNASDIRIDGTNIVLYFRNISNGTTVYIKYYIFNVSL